MSEAVIIGSGLGGLLSGAILSRAGYHVTVLEKAAQPGGCLQTFIRDGLRFDTGFHSVAGLEEGGPLERIFRPLGLMDLPWEHVAETDEIVQDGLSHRITDLSYPQGNALRMSSADVTREEYAHVMDPYKKGSWRLSSGNLLVQALAAFTVYCKLRPETLVYKPWSTTYDDNLMLHYGNPDGHGYARSADLLTFSEKEVPDRDARAESLIQRIPGLAPAVEKYWTSTPATWERFTGTPGGSAFGIRKKDATCFVHPRTPVPGLYLTGQNCGLHGVLGVSETALVTCREILGETTLNQIFQR